MEHGPTMPMSMLDGDVGARAADIAVATPGATDAPRTGALAGAADAAPDGIAAVSWRQCAEVVAVALVALGLSLTLPLATTVFALILFGVLHNYFEIRYVVGRFERLFLGRILEAAVIGLTAIVLVRLIAPATLARPLEIVALHALLGSVLVLRLHARPALLAAASTALAGSLAVSLSWADLYFVAIAQLHNVLPLVFLWEWTTRTRPAAPMRTFRSLHLGWALLLPAAILVGAFDGLALPDPTPAFAIVGDVEGLVRGLVPPGTDGAMTGRLLTVFAFLQLMHYYAWCRFFPSAALAETERANRTLAEIGLPHGRRLTVLALALAASTALLLLADFRLGRSLYGALAGYHAYLEYVIMVLLALAYGRR